MRRFLPLLILLIPSKVLAVPVVPNFSSGSMTAVTNTTSIVTETITSLDYNTGHTYSLNGTNLSIDGSTISPNPTTVNQTLNGTSYQWTGADLTTKPNVTFRRPVEAFQYVESYVGPGLSNYTTINRTTTIQ